MHASSALADDVHFLCSCHSRVRRSSSPAGDPHNSCQKNKNKQGTYFYEKQHVVVVVGVCVVSVNVVVVAVVVVSHAD